MVEEGLEGTGIDGKRLIDGDSGNEHNGTESIIVGASRYRSVLRGNDPIKEGKEGKEEEIGVDVR